MLLEVIVGIILVYVVGGYIWQRVDCRIEDSENYHHRIPDPEVSFWDRIFLTLCWGPIILLAIGSGIKERVAYRIKWIMFFVSGDNNPSITLSRRLLAEEKQKGLLTKHKVTIDPSANGKGTTDALAALAAAKDPHQAHQSD